MPLSTRSVLSQLLAVYLIIPNSCNYFFQLLMHFASSYAPQKVKNELTKEINKVMPLAHNAMKLPGLILHNIVAHLITAMAGEFVGGPIERRFMRDAFESIWRDPEFKPFFVDGVEHSKYEL